jgi:hypothetical protein
VAPFVAIFMIRLPLSPGIGVVTLSLPVRYRRTLALGPDDRLQ